MGAKTGKRKQVTNNLETFLSRNIYYRLFYLLDVGLIGWDGLPSYIDPIYIEQQLIERGNIAGFLDDLGELQMLSDIAIGTMDIYGRPISWSCIGVNGSIFSGLNKSNSWIGYNNYLRSGDMTVISYYADRIAKIDRAITVNAEMQKFPYIFSSNRDNNLTVQTFIKQFDSNQKTIVVDDDSQITDAVKVLNLNVPYVAGDLQLLKRQLICDCLDSLGIANVGIEKRERLTTEEVGTSNEAVNVVAQQKLACRKDFADHIQELFGIEITPYLRTKGGEPDGNLYNDLAGMLGEPVGNDGTGEPE